MPQNRKEKVTSMLERLFPRFNSESNQVDLVLGTFDDDGFLVDSYVLHSMEALPEVWINNRRKLTEFEMFNEALVWVSYDVEDSEMRQEERAYQESLLDSE